MTTVGTFNIRLFPSRGTQPEVVAQRIADLDADAIAVQEIRDVAAMEAMLSRADALTGRSYRVQLGPMCRNSTLQVGVVYDAQRFTSIESRAQLALDPHGRCSCREGHPPAFLSVLQEPGGARLAVMSVHMQFGARRWQLRARREQWDELIASIDRLWRELSVPIVAAGDFNSTGWFDDDGGERTLIERAVAQAGIAHATATLACTAYWRPNRRTRDYVPSMLDHVLVRGATVERVEALGMCQAYAGARRSDEEGNPDFHAVSDHCPVRVVLTP